MLMRPGAAPWRLRLLENHRQLIVRPSSRGMSRSGGAAASMVVRGRSREGATERKVDDDAVASRTGAAARSGQREPGDDGAVRARALSRPVRSRGIAARTGEDACLAD